MNVTYILLLYEKEKTRERHRCGIFDSSRFVVYYTALHIYVYTYNTPTYARIME